jgi:hypothetical protein
VGSIPLLTDGPPVCVSLFVYRGSSGSDGETCAQIIIKEKRKKVCGSASSHSSVTVLRFLSEFERLRVVL